MKGFAAAVLAVLSAFVGIRKRGAATSDESIKPQHLIAAGILCALVLVITLIGLVQLVLRAVGV